jgi:hypothetical protein
LARLQAYLRPHGTTVAVHPRRHRK